MEYLIIEWHKENNDDSEPKKTNKIVSLTELFEYLHNMLGDEVKHGKPRIPFAVYKIDCVMDFS